MTKISSQPTYKPDTEITGKDYLVGTDADKANKPTVSFLLEDLGSHFNMVNGSRNFDFLFYNHLGVSQAPANGCFYSNDNEQNPNNITHFFISKYTSSNKDVSQFFDSITTTNPFDLIVSQKIGLNSIFFFTIYDVESINGYYKLTVSEKFFPDSLIVEYKASNLVFNLKPNSESIHNNLSGLNEGNYIHLTEIEKEKFDGLPSTFVSNHSELNLDDGTNPHGTTKSNVGLGNVDNTSDADKLVSTAQQTALNLKQDVLTETNFGTFSDGLTTEDDIQDLDKVTFTDSSDSNKQKKTTWLNIKAKLTTVFNTLFVPQTRTITIGAETFDLSVNRTFSGGGDMTTTTDQTVSGVKTFLNLKLGLRNVANTFTSFFINSNTASRTYTLPNKSMTVAGTDDVATKMDLPVGGVANYLSKFLTATTIGVSRLIDTGSFFGIGTSNTPLKDLTLGNQSDREIGVEVSESISKGRDLTVTAGKAINYLINSEFTAVTNDQYYGSGATTSPNGDIYFQGFGAGLYRIPLGTNTIINVPSMGIFLGGISIGFDTSIYQTPYNGGTLTRNNIIVTGASGFTVTGILSSKLSNKLYAVFNGNIQYSTDNGVSFTVIQSGAVGIGRFCEDSFGNVYALISGFIWKQNLGTGLFVNTTIALLGTYIAIDTNNNIYSVDDSFLYKLAFGGTVYTTEKNISALPKGGVTGIAIDTNNRVFISCGLNQLSLQFQLLTSALGTADLDGGILKLKAGTGKGTGTSRVQLVTGAKTVSGTDMQTERVRVEIDEDGTTNFYNNSGIVTNYVNADGTNSFSNTVLTATQVFDFLNEEDKITNTILNASITNANIKSFSFIPIETYETSLDDFSLNGLSFSIANIIDNVSFDIIGTALNNASGNYTIKYLITI